MPLERVSQGFKDLSMTFQSNPLNDDLIALKNANAIARSVRNIVLTTPGEKIFDPEFGSSVNDLLFENVDDIEIFNKKAIYLYIREITGLNTKQIVNNLNKMRQRYRNFRKSWHEGKL